MTRIKSPRREKAQATRRAIVRAAHAEFIARGYSGATIASVAQAAGVAPQTIYFVFHTKAALISAAIDAAVMGDDDPRPPEESPWYAEMLTEPDAAQALRVFIRGAAPIFARASALGEVLRAAALTDDEVRATYLHHESLRHASFTRVVAQLTAKGELQSGLTVQTATDVLLTVFSDATFHTLIVERGWSQGDVTQWLCDALPRLLLMPLAAERQNGDGEDG